MHSRRTKLAMTDLNTFILMHAPRSWDQTTPLSNWDEVSSPTQTSHLAFAKQLVQALIDAGVLAELSAGHDATTWSVEADQALQKLRGVTELKDLPTRLTQAAKLQMHMVPDGLFDTFMSIRGREE